jgi:hypothetical protein
MFSQTCFHRINVAQFEVGGAFHIQENRLHAGVEDKRRIDDVNKGVVPYSLNNGVVPYSVHRIF